MCFFHAFSPKRYPVIQQILRALQGPKSPFQFRDETIVLKGAVKAARKSKPADIVDASDDADVTE